jgi:hypothetical protein
LSEGFPDEKLCSMQSTSESNRSPAAIRAGEAKGITITIAYDEKRAGQRAAELFSLIGQESEGNVNIAIQPWRFDMLADPDWRKFAAAEALQADILVMAMSNPAHLSAAIEQWFRTWLEDKRGFHAAVIALIATENEADALPSPELKFLENATREAGLDFFTPRLGRPRHRWETRNLPPQAFSYRRPYRHWGINE